MLKVIETEQRHNLYTYTYCNQFQSHVTVTGIK